MTIDELRRSAAGAAARRDPPRGLVDNGFAFAEMNAACAESSYSYTATKGTFLASSCTLGIVQGSVTGHKDMSTDSDQANPVADPFTSKNQQPGHAMEMGLTMRLVLVV